MKWYGFIVGIIVLSFTGCGTTGGDRQNPQPPAIKLGDIYHEGDEINITKAKEEIRKQLGDIKIIKMYVAPDKKDIFVITGGRLEGFSLIDFDIARDKPAPRNTIVEWTDNRFVAVVPLLDGKLIYQIYTPVNLSPVTIYDYILEKELALYYIWYDENEPYKVSVNKDFNSFSIQKVSVDIQDLYRQLVPSKRTIYRDNEKGIVVDPTNQLVWQDDSSVGEKSYSFREAVAYCRELQTQSSYMWRVPTLTDIHKLMTQEDKVFDYSLFQYRNSDTYSSYWLDSDSIGTSYYMINKSYDNISHYLTINIDPKTDKFESSAQLYVRCVASY